MSEAHISKCSESNSSCHEDAAHLSAGVFETAKKDYVKIKNAVNNGINEVENSFHDVFTGHSTTREKLIVGGLALGAIASGLGEFLGGSSLLSELQLAATAAGGSTAAVEAEATALELGARSAAETESLTKALGISLKPTPLTPTSLKMVPRMTDLLRK